MKPSGINRTYWLTYNLYFLIEHFVGRALFDKVFGKARNKLIARIGLWAAQKRANISLGLEHVEVTSIEEMTACDALFTSPVVFRGGASNWEAFGKWTFDFFVEKFGDREIMVHDNEGLIDPNNPQQFETILLSEYIKHLKEGSLKYLKFSRLVHDHPDLQKDLNLDELEKLVLPGSFGNAFYMFMGAAKTITPIHDGLGCTVFVNLEGRKRWIMWPTEEKIFLDVRPSRMNYYFSKANPHVLTDSNYPLLKYARKFDITLESGDILWFPPWMWHQVENETATIGTAFKFTNLKQAFRASKLQTFLFFFATKPFLIQAYWTSLFKKEDYIYTKKANAHKLKNGNAELVAD